MSEVDRVLAEWLGLDEDEIAKAAVIIRQAVEADMAREQYDAYRNEGSQR